MDSKTWFIVLAGCAAIAVGYLSIKVWLLKRQLLRAEESIRRNEAHIGDLYEHLEGFPFEDLAPGEYAVVGRVVRMDGRPTKKYVLYEGRRHYRFVVDAKPSQITGKQIWVG